MAALEVPKPASTNVKAESKDFFIKKLNLLNN